MDDLLQARLNELAHEVGRLERKIDFILNHLNLTYIDDPEAGIPPELADVFDLLKQGKKLQALQLYRQKTKANANEAIVAVDKLESRLKK